MPLSHLISAHQDTQMPGTSYINANFLMLSHPTGFGGFTVSFLKSAKVKRRAVVFQWRDGPSLLHHHSFCSGFPQSSACKMLYRMKNKVHAPSRTSEPKSIRRASDEICQTMKCRLGRWAIWGLVVSFPKN